MICTICSNTQRNSTLWVREIMFGTDEIFRYLECADCGCLQLIDIPDNISNYYPKNYYSFIDSQNFKKYNKLKRTLIIDRDKYLIGKKFVFGGLLNMIFKSFYSLPLKFSYQILLSKKEARLLDLGCGSGDFISYLRSLGFDNVFGSDPFITKSIDLNGTQFLYKNSIFELPLTAFDGIMLNHSFEHMAEPLKVLLAIKDKLADNGICMIRVPVADSKAFSAYKESWFQLDAPRHLYIYTNKSMEILAKNAGFEIVAIENDSNIKQFLSSILYKEGIPLVKQNFENHFSKAEINKFEEATKTANIEGTGDQRAYYLKKAVYEK